MSVVTIDDAYRIDTSIKLIDRFNMNEIQPEEAVNLIIALRSILDESLEMPESLVA